MTRNILSCCLCSAALFFGLNNSTLYAQSEPQILFANVVGQKPHYRIPAIAMAPNGMLMAFSDHRYGNGDIGSGRIDVAMRTSYDQGLTWSDQQVIVQGDDETGYGYGDAAVCVDPDSNRMMMLTASGIYGYSSSKGNLVVARTYLTLDKTQSPATWVAGEPTDITSQFYNLLNIDENNYERGMFFASGRICVSRSIKVNDCYRIYSAVLVRNKGNYVFYSDDFGQTWNLLGNRMSCVPSGDEAKVEELPNGNVIISSRKSKGRFFNIFSYTDALNGKGAWSVAVDSNEKEGGPATSSNATNGELLLVPAISTSGENNEPTWIALQSGPTGTQRADVTIFWKVLDEPSKYDTAGHFASNWNGSYQVSSTLSCYSTMIRNASGNICFLYEEDVVDNYFYDIKYQELSLETITNGQYKACDVPANLKSVMDNHSASEPCYNLLGQTIDGSASGFQIRSGQKLVYGK